MIVRDRSKESSLDKTKSELDRWKNYGDDWLGMTDQIREMTDADYQSDYDVIMTDTLGIVYFILFYLISFYFSGCSLFLIHLFVLCSLFKS